MNNEDLIKRIWAKESCLKQMRGYLHQYPEVSANELETAKFLQNAIAKIGLPIIKIAGTGFYAVLDTGKPGKTVALRAEIDALPMDESPENLCGLKKWVTKNQGVSHICGHDAHMAMLLITISVLSEIKNSLCGKIIFVFEEGEEIGSGIKAMVAAIKNLSIDAIFGMHVTSFMQSGMICADEGPKMAGSVLVEFEIKGKGGHGSRPDLSVNPLFATAQVISGISSAWSNRINVEEMVTLGLTQIHCGTANNIIPESAVVSGSLRFYNETEAKHAIEVLNKTIHYTAMAHQCQAFTDKTRIVNSPVINNSTLSKIATKGINELLPGHIINGVKWYASESFCHYSAIAPICFTFLGVGNPLTGSGAEHHNDHFDIDEDALKYGVAAQVKFTIDFLSDLSNQ